MFNRVAGQVEVLAVQVNSENNVLEPMLHPVCIADIHIYVWELTLNDSKGLLSVNIFSKV